MSSSLVLKALGLNLSPNALDLPNGSLSKASNVIIKRDNVIEQRRGFKLYGSSFGSDSSRVSQLFAYKGRILRQYATSLQYDSDGAGTFSTFNGSYTQAQSGLRTKSIESNGNLYFTSSDGIKVISASTNADFTTSAGFITNAGVPKAIDFKLKAIDPSSGSSGFLPQHSTVAYRTSWNIKDANSNQKEGSPSQPVVIYNSILSLLIPNFMDTLEALDNLYISPLTGFFNNNGNYVNSFKVTTSDTATTLRTNLISLASQIDNDIRYASDSASNAPLNISEFKSYSNNTARITFSAGDPTNYFTNSTNKQIYLSGFGTITSVDPNGARTVVTVTSSYIEFNLTGTTSGDSGTFTAGEVRSGRYRNIAQPTAPSAVPTTTELVAIQTYLESIITYLQSELTTVISSGNQTAYVADLGITSDVNVRLTIQMPQDVTANDYLQIYRSTTITATGTDILSDLVPNSEETQLVYEAYPTAAELAAKVMIVDDITPDIFKGANLYTNQSTGEGILQANDVPPFALDINKFKNYVFYANTKTRHRIIPFSLIGVANMVDDALNNSITPKITIANASGTHNTYTFTLGTKEVTTILCVQKSSITEGSYFDINSADDVNQYRFYFYKAVNTPPSAGGRTLVKIDISNAGVSTAAQVGARVRDVLAGYVNDFTTSLSTATVTVTNVNYGYTTDASAGSSGFTVTVTTQGTGESIANKQILLSQDVSPATAVDDTARSMIRVINGNSSETIYGFYTSSLGQVPGKMVLESRNLNDTPFYLIGNNSNTGGSFFPNISPIVELGVSAGRISIANPTVVTSTGHGLSNNDEILITNSNSTPSIDGVYTVTVLTSDTFTVPVHVTVAGTKLSYTVLGSAEVSQNESKANRIYYSKLLQPEAVPIVNYLDVGARDKAILRIMPLRDSLFIFKEDGLFRISGETSSSFYLSLFDSSCILVAPDSVSISNNLIYTYTRQGISTVSEAGVITISRPIDTEILKISSSDYTDFATSTWGIGYESDNSYTVFTIQKTDDTSASIGYRYSNLTNTWTTVDKDSICGIINPADDRLYLAAGDTNYIEQERKSFSRLDYADREITSTISNNAYITDQIKLGTVTGLAVGDVVVQEQLITPFKFNSLLQKLDLDPTVGAVDISAISGASVILTITANAHNLADGDYVTISNNTSVPAINGTYKATYLNANQFKITIASPLTTTIANGSAKLNYRNTLVAGPGDNLRSKLVALAAKLDTDPGIAGTTYSSLIDVKSGSITGIGVGTPSSITSVGHGLESGRYIIVTGTNSIPNVNGSWAIIKTGSGTFTIPTTVNTAGTSGSYLTDVESFQDIKGCFNIIINTLNTDSGVSFNNYRTVTDTTSVETIITEIETATKKITIKDDLEFIVGPITIYKAIESSVTYSPNTMGDPLGLKQIREATVMFLNRAFTGATLSFATDLLPRFNDIDFTADGPGTFGSANFGSGFFGGGSNSAPFRTIIPRNSQRCRFIVVKFTHKTARESYAIYGVSLTGSIGISERAYR
jgi:hypothetical protein